TVIVGVNKYRKETEDALETLEVDNQMVRTGQIARLAKVREGRDEAACRAALAALTAGCASGENVLALAVQAARYDATLGEISAAMEEVFGRHDATPAPVSGVYASAYEFDRRWAQVTDGVAAVGRRLGRAPRIMIAKMGQDGHDRGANVIASAFADMGFDVVSGPLFQTPEESAAMALAKDVDVVGASSLAAGHKTLIPELIRLLREVGRGDIKVTAGGVIPPQDYDYLREAGVQGIYGPGSNVVECAADILVLLGHNMPPPGDLGGEGLDEAAE
ncbi:MAG: hypothetical protein RIT17_1772, partial [Pseudomonadota bacterium]